MVERKKKKIKVRVLIWGVLYSTAMYSHPQQTNNSVLNVTPLKKTNNKIGIQRVNYVVKRCVQRNSKCILFPPRHIPQRKKEKEKNFKIKCHVSRFDSVRIQSLS